MIENLSIELSLAEPLVPDTLPVGSRVEGVHCAISWSPKLQRKMVQLLLGQIPAVLNIDVDGKLPVDSVSGLEEC